MPAPKGNKNRQKGLHPKTERVAFRTTQEIKTLIDNHVESTGEPLSELMERLLVSYFKK